VSKIKMSPGGIRKKFWRFGIAHPDNISIIDSNCDRWIKVLGWLFILSRRKFHSKELFCLESNLAFVKCMICGSESIPWRVKSETAKEWRETNGHRLEKLWGFERKRRVRR
jgi:hypothetical protein